MMKLSRHNYGRGIIHRISTKRRRLPSVSTDDSSSMQEEDEKTLVVLSDDSDSDEDITLQSSKRRISSSPKSVTLPSSNVLDCPNCFEPLTKPIYQCNNGHLACFVCCIKLKKRCSFCKLPIGDVRCRAMEKVIKAGLVSCSNAMYGCKESTPYGNKLLSHERVCVFVPCSCPVKDCNYIGSYKDLNNHFRGAHKRSLGYIFGLELRRSIIFCLEQDVSDQMVIFQEEKEGDVIVVESFTGSEGVYVTVSHIAPTVPGVRKFSSSLARIQEHSTLRLGLRVKNIQKSRKLEEQPEDDFLLIPSYMLSGVHIKMEISIGNEDAYVHI